ncbi:uncharacterized protein LOC142165956 [Nicotiana tabacum]|uniref:Uncharacterized protein LOC142165956 n=1 Tax=Nicotiana tabacum TaxID=4097 RepID=A0AC58S661_TOBAC
MTWFEEGDRNTRFFHNCVNGKRQKLQLKRIQNSDGSWIEDQDKLSEAAMDFFQKQFTKEGDPTRFDLLNNVPTMVTREQNLEFCRLPTMEEVKAIVFALSSESASGPDGYSENQYGFVKGRSIFENILLTQEIITDIRLREYFINMVWNLIANNWYSVMVNGQASGFFHSTRGVKQGDPLSLALFILSAEVLSRSLNKLFEDRQKIVYVLVLYETTSGQMINKAKSSYYMHSKVTGNLVNAVANITGFSKGSFLFTYLGCPIFYTRIRKDYYNDLIKKEIANHIRQEVHFANDDDYLDTSRWMPTPLGKFTMSSAWRILRHREPSNPEFAKLWTKGLPFKISFFLWRVWKGKVPTDDLWKRGVTWWFLSAGVACHHKKTLPNICS